MPISHTTSGFTHITKSNARRKSSYRFMWTLHTANEEHWVPIATIASFKRMREFQPRGIEWVANVLRTSAQLQVSEDGTKVRRSAEVQKPKDAFDRSVYAVRLLQPRPVLPPRVTNTPYRRASVKRFRGFSVTLSSSFPSMERWPPSVCGVLMGPRRSRYAFPV